MKCLQHLCQLDLDTIRCDLAGHGNQLAADLACPVDSIVLALNMADRLDCERKRLGAAKTTRPHRILCCPDGSVSHPEIVEASSLVMPDMLQAIGAHPRRFFVGACLFDASLGRSYDPERLGAIAGHGKHKFVLGKDERP